MEKHTKSIGIIGGGFIGQVLKRYYPDSKIYDIIPELSNCTRAEVLKQDIIFIAFNIKDNAISEDSLNILYDYLGWIEAGRIIIIKSTFVPGTTDKLQLKYPHLNFIYNPEFLTELTAWEDFTEPQFQILGCPHQSLQYIHEIFKILPEAEENYVISPIDAEVLKHAFNSYYATKVTWFNQLYDATKGLGADYETVRSIMVKNKWVGDSHSVIFHKGYIGWGGKCLSKDVPAFAKVTGFPILKHIIEYNEEKRKQQDLFSLFGSEADKRLL